MIVCIAIIGQEKNPLYLKSFSSQTDELKFHFIVHTALDLIDEKQRGAASVDHYLGLLYPTEAFMVYGYTTSTEITFVVVTDEADTKDAELKALFTKLHDLYVDVVSNPFYVGNSPIQSNRFNSNLGQLLAP